MKSEKADELPEISRFESVLEPKRHLWECEVGQDAISVQLIHAATLTSIGLFGNKNKETIPVKSSVRNNRQKLYLNQL